jgi:hypothetical protein
MPASDSYGDAFGKRLNAQAKGFVARALPRTTIAVTELRYDNPEFVLSTPPIEEDAFLVGVHLKLFEHYEYWENGKAAPVAMLRPGEAIIYHARRKPTFHLNSAFHSVHFTCRWPPSMRLPTTQRPCGSASCTTSRRSATRIRSCAVWPSACYRRSAIPSA